MGLGFGLGRDDLEAFRGAKPTPEQRGPLQSLKRGRRSEQHREGGGERGRGEEVGAVGALPPLGWGVCRELPGPRAGVTEGVDGERLRGQGLGRVRRW